jgi:hypothetical protein
MEPKKSVPRPFTPSKRAAKAARVFPEAAPTVTAAVDRPARPFQPPARAPAVGAGPVNASTGGGTATVTVAANGQPKRGSRQTLPKAAPEPPPPTAMGPVTSATTGNVGVVRVEVRAVAGETRNPPNATRFRFPPPRAAPLAPPDPAAVKTLAAAALRAAAGTTQ